MSGLKEAKLSSLGCSFLSGFAFKSSEYKQFGIPLIKIGNIQNKSVKVDNNGDYIDAESLDIRKSNYLLCDGDVLIAMTGQGSVGRVGRLKLNNDQKALLNQRVGKFLCDENTINLDYLFYILSSDKYQEYLFNTGAGSGQPNLSPELILDTEIPLLDYSEQFAIGQLLNSLDSKIDLLHRQNKTLEKMAETLFRQWFIEDAKEDWEDVPLDDFFDFLEGPGIRNWQYTDSGTPFINIRLINNGDIDTSKANFVSDEEANGKYSHFHLKDRDMIVSTSGTLGKSAIVRSYHLPMILNTSVIRFKPKDGKSYSFVYQYLNSRLFQEHLESTASGSVQANFGPTHLKKMTFTKPAADVLDKFSSKADLLYEKIRVNSQQIRTLEKLRETLLPKLMSGEVKVTYEQGAVAS